MPTPIKRRCFVEILEDGKVKFTNSYNTREIEFKNRNKKYCIDLVSFAELSDQKDFNAVIYWEESSGNFRVSVWNEQATGFTSRHDCLGLIGIGNGLPLSNNFECVLIEED